MERAITSGWVIGQNNPSDGAGEPDVSADAYVDDAVLIVFVQGIFTFLIKHTCPPFQFRGWWVNSELKWRWRGPATYGEPQDMTKNA